MINNREKVKLGGVLELKYGKPLMGVDRNPNGSNPVYGANGILAWTNKFLLEGENIIVGRKGSAGEINRISGKCWPSDVTYYVSKKEDLVMGYIYYLLKSLNLPKLAKGVKPGLNRNDVYRISVSIPEHSEQRKIVKKLDQASLLIEKRKESIKLLDEYIKLFFLDMFGNPESNSKGFPIFKLGEKLELITYGLTIRPKYLNEGIPLISAKEIRSGEINYSLASKISQSDFQKLSEKAKPTIGDILFSKTGSIGHCAIVLSSKDFAITQNAARLKFNKEINPFYALYYLRTSFIQNLSQSSAKGNAVKDLQLGVMKQFKFIVPPIELQDRFSKLVKKERALQGQMFEQLKELEMQLLILYQSIFKY
ncbi:restriction endonuclease subunit S [Candidatus Dojkabacteria bacterium]|jgi:type I restriction enzyme S subunit|nr:restriction endonuclease subunit S [Candidatus Dojkabacteria bacterium]